MIIISACLGGINCKYDGHNNYNDNIVKIIKEGKAVLVCPEQLGGLSTPRYPAEIVNGDGKDVLNGKARVINKMGEDVTEEFIKGATETLKIAKLYGIKKAILKARSPSCGNCIIYDGSFSSVKKRGDGVTTALLRIHGIDVKDEESIE